MEFSPMHVTESGIGAMGLVLRLLIYGGIPLAILGLAWARRVANGSLQPNPFRRRAFAILAFAGQIATGLLALLGLGAMIANWDDPFLDRYLLAGAGACVVLSIFAVPAWRSLRRPGHHAPGERVAS